ncbi:MAG: amidase, partial [Planctomycetota bacterium]
SSGPGVATAAGLCFASLGTDTGGSIRFPSMANGIVGLKPTYGRVSRYGVLALAESLDHVGPMARNVADAAAVFEVIAGADANDPTSLSSPAPDMLGALNGDIRGLRIGFDRAYATDGVDPGLVASIEVALAELENLGAQVVEVEVPEFTPGHFDAWFSIVSYEAVAAHALTYPSRAGDYGEFFREFLETGSTITDEAYAAAGRVREDFSDRFHAVLSSVDAVVCPAGGVPYPASADIRYGGMPDPAVIRTIIWFRFTFPANFAGTPTVTLPCGAEAAGAPYAMQFMGSRLSEPLLLRIAHAYEQSTDWHTRHPPV